MRSFKEVYVDNKNKVNENLKVAADKERVELLKAIRREYGIKDFNGLSESEKLQYKNLIKEMWSPETGLNERGKKLVNESKMTLSSDSDEEQIKRYITKEMKSDLKNYLLWFASEGVNGQNPNKIKKDIDSQMGKKVNSSLFKEVIVELLTDYLVSKIKHTKING